MRAVVGDDVGVQGERGRAHDRRRAEDGGGGRERLGASASVAIVTGLQPVAAGRY